MQKVSLSLDAANAALVTASKHLDSALLLADADPDDAYTLLYDAARKAFSAVPRAQGLRATSRGGHYAIQEATTAQFTKPPPRDSFRAYARLRRTRNQIEYDDISPVTADDVRADADAVTTLVTTAGQIMTLLPVFTD